MNNEISDEKLIDCKVIFDIFDKDKDGIITIDELEDSIRAVGLNPIQNELIQIKSDIDKQFHGKITFAKFVEIFIHFQKSILSEKDLTECFAIFDSDQSGFISLEEFKKAMTTMGDMMDENTFDDIVAGAEIINGQINYKQFVEKLMQK